jgi:hypothetical protein
MGGVDRAGMYISFFGLISHIDFYQHNRWKGQAFEGTEEGTKGRAG